ncbi:MAG TPA: hypothetical protein VMV18_15870 [bacterium]|nr:hypothetical protein [bacterium]
MSDSLFTWLHAHSWYFLTLEGNSQAALALFAGGLLSWMLYEAFANKRDIDAARAHLPLVIGGWGTRGKSGTERLKAGLFTGMGYEVFCKTTGCEAMMIHAPGGQEPVEMFIFRPYDKSSIWEQRDLLLLGSRLDAEVFLWECMALNPVYVQILQREWMRDDVSTLTNAYPDHEDIQGPRGINVAEVISCFIPDKAKLVTSELSYKPIFDLRAEERDTQLAWVGKRTGDLIAQDVLDLFPYNEHPRNIALVARVAQELGLDRSFAIATMAENVVPDLGVLKTFPEVRVRGRRLTFINGFSANDPTGTIGNWRRTGCDRFDPDDAEASMVTVVNNRADRPARSQVFARLVVENLPADRHVLIGTNLEGLQGLIRQALTRFAGELKVILDGELGGDGRAPMDRLGRHLAMLRVPPPSADRALARLEVFARGADLGVDASKRAALRESIAKALAAEGADATLDPVALAASLAGSLGAEVGAALVTKAGDYAVPEVVAPPTREDVLRHFFERLARMAVRARLESRLAATLNAKGDVEAFHAAFRKAYEALFLQTLDVLHDAEATGDQVIARVAAAAPPGAKVSVMGLQNIKGTGLDFVYRWIALDKTTRALTQLASRAPERRIEALKSLELFEDYGVVDSGVALSQLAGAPASDAGDEERALFARAKARLEEVHAHKLAGLESARAEKTRRERFLEWTEGWLDWLDAIRRRRTARAITEDLVNRRISHRQASIELRNLYYRQKGGWLRKDLDRPSPQ